MFNAWMHIVKSVKSDHMASYVVQYWSNRVSFGISWPDRYWNHGAISWVTSELHIQFSISASAENNGSQCCTFTVKCLVNKVQNSKLYKLLRQVYMKMNWGQFEYFYINYRAKT